jgi:hypothetical protein
MPVFAAAIVLLVISACGASPQPTATPTASTDEGLSPPPHRSRALPSEQGDLFAASGACASCHSNLEDEAGQDVSMDTDWRAAMMANAARDPYWQASVRLQVLDLPHLKGAIEEKCATCHTPMARFAAMSIREESLLLDGGFLEEGHPRHALAIDGVSCTLCHQIEEGNLGTPESFSGGFSIDT